MSGSLLREWCCGTPTSEPHADGCGYSPENPIDYTGPAIEMPLHQPDDIETITMTLPGTDHIWREGGPGHGCGNDVGDGAEQSSGATNHGPSRDHSNFRPCDACTRTNCDEVCPYYPETPAADAVGIAAPTCRLIVSTDLKLTDYARRRIMAFYRELQQIIADSAPPLHVTVKRWEP